MIQFAREILSPELWAEAMPLLTAHWQEVRHFEDIPLDPDYAVYEASEAAGMLRCFTARESYPGNVHGPRLVGYSLFFVRPHPHYKSSLQAAQDVIYLDPSVRGGTGAKFIAWCDAQLTAGGVEVVSQHVKAAHDFGKLLQRQGYELMDLIYVKRLNRVDSTLATPSVCQVMAGTTEPSHVEAVRPSVPIEMMSLNPSLTPTADFTGVRPEKDAAPDSSRNGDVGLGLFRVRSVGGAASGSESLGVGASAKSGVLGSTHSAPAGQSVRSPGRSEGVGVFDCAASGAPLLDEHGDNVSPLHATEQSRESKLSAEVKAIMDRDYATVRGTE